MWCTERFLFSFHLNRWHEMSTMSIKSNVLSLSTKRKIVWYTKWVRKKCQACVVWKKNMKTLLFYWQKNVLRVGGKYSEIEERRRRESESFIWGLKLGVKIIRDDSEQTFLPTGQVSPPPLHYLPLSNSQYQSVKTKLLLNLFIFSLNNLFNSRRQLSKDILRTEQFLCVLLSKKEKFCSLSLAWKKISLISRYHHLLRHVNSVYTLV